MLTRKTMLLTGAVLLAAAACDTNRASNANNNASASQPSPELEQPAGGTAVTNTGAAVEVDPLASVEDKDRVKRSPDEVKILPNRPAQLITGFAAAVRTSPNGEETTTIEKAVNGDRGRAGNRAGDYLPGRLSGPGRGSRRRSSPAGSTRTRSKTPAGPRRTKTSGGSLQNTMASKLDCSHGESHLRTSHDFCGKTCKDDGSCDKKNGALCDGLAFDVHERTNKLTTTRFCIPSAK